MCTHTWIKAETRYSPALSHVMHMSWTAMRVYIQPTYRGSFLLWICTLYCYVRGYPPVDMPWIHSVGVIIPTELRTTWGHTHVRDGKLKAKALWSWLGWCAYGGFGPQGSETPSGQKATWAESQTLPSLRQRKETSVSCGLSHHHWGRTWCTTCSRYLLCKMSAIKRCLTTFDDVSTTFA